MNVATRRVGRDCARGLLRAGLDQLVAGCGCLRLLALPALIAGLVVFPAEPAAAQFCLSPNDCNDGLFCTAELCIGVCIFPARDCNDSDPCTADVCSENQNRCIHNRLAPGAACDDGNPFTFGERCDQVGTCRIISQFDCLTDADCPLAFTCRNDGTCVPVPTLPVASTATRTATRTLTRTATRTATRTGTRTGTATASPTRTPTRTATRTGTSTHTATPTFSSMPTPSSTSTATATHTVTSTGTPTLTETPTLEPTPTATFTPPATMPPTLAPTDSATPTASSTATADAPATPTSTVTNPTATGSPSPPPTPTDTPDVALRCTGDCNADGQVAINELVTGVTLALSGVPPAACPSLDANASGRIEINELLAAVNHALAGCPASSNLANVAAERHGVPCPFAERFVAKYHSCPSGSRAASMRSPQGLSASASLRG